MLHHRTTDRGIRAMHIAENVAGKAYCETGDATAYFRILSETYDETLAELEPP